MGGWRWLLPGLHLKRWVLAICAGIVLLILGAMALALALFNPPTPDGGGVPFNLYRVGGILIAAGGLLVFTGVYRLVRRIEKILKREGDDRGLAELAWQQTRLSQGPKIACLGGGHGLSTLLTGLRNITDDLTAIVSVADDGGSSGRLRLGFDLLPPGDLRNCLVALADAGPVTADLMQYRFEEGEFAGHSFGNLLLLVLAKIRGDFGAAVREANRILNVRGRVLAATLDKISLVATHPDGAKTTGQRHIATSNQPIEALELKPAPGAAPDDVLEALGRADLIVFGPGSLYTSVLPTLLESDTVEAINRSPALTVWVVNTADQPGETAGFAVSRHLKAIRKHAPRLRIDRVLVNDYRPAPHRLEPLAAEGIRLTDYDRKETAELGIPVILRDVIDAERPTHHDPRKLSTALLELWQQRREEAG